MASTSKGKKVCAKQTEGATNISSRLGSLFCVVASAHLHTVEFEIEAFDGLQAVAGLDVLGISQHADVDRDLEMVLLLADEGIIGQGEVEALVGVDTVGRHRTLKGAERDLNILIMRIRSLNVALLGACSLTPSIDRECISSLHGYGYVRLCGSVCTGSVMFTLQ